MIEASVVAGQVTTMQGNESTLNSEVTSIVGLPGYKNALNHYNNYVARLSNWSTRIVTVEGVVLAQTPQGYPGTRRSSSPRITKFSTRTLPWRTPRMTRASSVSLPADTPARRESRRT